MPKAEIPVEDMFESGSSLSSLTSRRSERDPVSDNQNVSRHSISSSNLSYRDNGDHPISEENEDSGSGQNVPPRYEPIIIPAEPSLDELLKQVTGRTDLANVTQVQLRIISSMISLQRINLFMPNLVALNLDGSVVSSLRDLGCGLTSLKYLNVSHCGLTSLDGTSGLCTLEELFADGNQIKNIGPCCNISGLKTLSLRNNRIADIDLVSFLALCSRMKTLDLIENPVTKIPCYREIVKEQIPQLTSLDGVVFDEPPKETDNTEIHDFEHNDNSVSECTSSLTSSEPSYAWNDPQTIKPSWTTNNEEKRATTAREYASEELMKDIFLRPISSEPMPVIIQLTNAEPMCGSIVSKARNRRQRTAWGESTSSSSATTSRSVSPTLKNFPSRLPQEPIELELGVIGVVQQTSQAAAPQLIIPSQFNDNTVNNNHIQNENDDNLIESQRLLDAARNWRQASQRTRQMVQHSDNLRILDDYVN